MLRFFFGYEIETHRKHGEN